VGQVVAVYPHASEVLLVTDSTHQLPVQVTRTRDRAIAIGVGLLNRLELRNLPDTVDMVSGDLLETSGLGGRFQSGIPVARVIDVIRSPGQPFARVMAVPIAQLSRLSLVMVDVSTEGSR
ncbi:rod shape-determining protein MreC, partial [Litorivicinus sp.]|nr:rod shape-determining protein MreC [Litorivicinus sp.]